MNMLKRVLILTAALLLPSVGLLAQVSVGGTVVDAGGKALPGATVSVEGTSTGAVTAGDGSFTLKVPGEESVLLFESLGYKSVKMKVGKLRQFNVTLEEDAT